MNSTLPPTEPPKSSSRRWALAGIGALAGLGGLGAAWFNHGREPVVSGAEAALWALQFDSPAGAPLAMASFRGRPVVVNFWATWCPPCVEELPLLNAFYREHAAKGWQVVGMAIDQPSAVRNFLQKTPVGFPIGMAGLGGTDLVKSLGNLTGGLPFTVVLGADGNVLHRKMGQISPTDLQLWASLK